VSQDDLGSRLAELLVALSLVTDLARGRPDEEAMGACLIATDLAGRLGLDPGDVATVYYATLLRFIGCTGTSHEYGETFGGDDIAVRARGDLVDFGRPSEAARFLLSVTADSPVGLAAAPRAFGRGKKTAQEGIVVHCEIATQMARRFRFSADVENALADMFERFDGRGGPRGIAGEDIAVAARIAAVAFAVTMFAAAGGPGAALAALERWSGRLLDPGVCALASRDRDRLTALLDGDAYVGVLAAEPEPRREIAARDLDEIADGFAAVVDLKSVYFHGHSAGVAALAERAARAAGLSDAEADDVRRAGLLHDLGRAGVPTGIWEKRGALSTSEWERVRLHPYHTARILSRSATLASLADLAAGHHERMDGTGYHRGIGPDQQTMAARILAVADAAEAMSEDRPHRPALSDGQIAGELKSAVANGSLDRDAVAAVLEASGRANPPARLPGPADLTAREVEVARLLARGMAEKDVAKALYISRTTVHTHAQHIYAKAGVTTRAALAVFVMERGLALAKSSPERMEPGAGRA
jgi:HD-GYP domain-containing protein (c-di-GMP phosphodiesterase class II)